MNSNELNIIQLIENKLKDLNYQQNELKQYLVDLPNLNEPPYSDIILQLDNIIHYQQKLNQLKSKMNDSHVKQLKMIERSEKLKLVVNDHYSKIEQRKEVQIEKIKAKIATSKIINVSRADSSSGNQSSKPVAAIDESEGSKNLDRNVNISNASDQSPQTKEIVITTKKKAKSKPKKERTIDPKFLKLMDRLNVEENKSSEQ